MIKNMTRKGLAIGSAVALGITGFVSAPAQAAITNTTRVTIAEDSGVGFNVTAVNSQTFTLTSTVANSLRGAATTGLKWLVTDPSSALAATFDNNADDTYANNENSGSVGTRAVNGSFIVNPADFTAELRLTMGTATTSSYSSTVTAWYDDNSNNVIDTDEYAASATVNFLLPSAVSSSVVVTSPIIGDTSYEGYVVTNPVLNYAQAALPTVKTTWQGNASEFNATVTRDSTNDRFKFVAERSMNLTAAATVASNASVITSNGHGLANGEIVTVAGLTAATGTTAGLNGTKTVSSVDTNTFSIAAGGGTGAVTASSATAKVQVVAGTYSAQPAVGSNNGTKNTFGVSTAVADDGTAAVTSSSDLKVSGNDTDAVSVTVRPTVKSVTGSLFFVDTNDAALAAGKPVRLTVTTITNATGVKLNDVSRTQGQTVDAVTAAGGRVDFTVTTTSGVATDVVTITGVAEGVAGTSAAVTYTWTAVSNSFSDMNNTGSSVVRSIAVGGSYTFDFAITDNWGVAPTGSWRVKVAVSGNTVSETYPAMSGGRVSVTVTDAQISTGNISVVATPQRLNDSNVWQDNGANAVVPAAVTYTLIPVSQTGAAVSGSASNSGTIASSTATLVAGDTRNSQLAVTSSGGFTISGAVTNATTGATRPGALVTVTGPSTILFYKGTKAAYGTLTFHADATTGAYEFGAVSNIAQTESVVKVASQGGSRDVKVTFERAAATTGKTLEVNAPASVVPGSTLVVKVKLTDKFGNPVRNNDGTTLQANNAVTVTYTGPGLIVGDISNRTDGNGEITVRVLLGANDSGSASVSAVFQNNTSGTTDDVTVTKTITIGAAATTGKVNVGSFNGKLVVYAQNLDGKRISWKVGGNWGKATAVGNTLNRFDRPTPRRGVTVSVQIYVDGVLQLTKSVVTR